MFTVITGSYSLACVFENAALKSHRAWLSLQCIWSSFQDLSPCFAHKPKTKLSRSFLQLHSRTFIYQFIKDYLYAKHDPFFRYSYYFNIRVYQKLNSVWQMHNGYERCETWFIPVTNFRIKIFQITQGQSYPYNGDCGVAGRFLVLQQASK